MSPARVCLIAALVCGVSTVGSTQGPKLGDVIARLSAYLEQYERRLSAVVADEFYRQTMDVRSSAPKVVVDPQRSRPPLGHRDRVLRSDYALTRAADKEAWVGYRDTFEVDGRPVRDREDRLQRLLSSDAPASAARIAAESARFNLGNSIVTRNVNVPTLALEMLHPRNQDRFDFKKTHEEQLGNVRTWQIEFTEKQRPTFIRNSNGRDRISHGQVWVNPASGEIWRTMIWWNDAPNGTITVTFGQVGGIDTLVPLTMSERYTGGDATLTGEASYSNYRQFQTSARLVTHPQ